MPAMYAAPAIDHNVGTKFANHAHHVFQNRVSPDFFRFRNRLGISEILRAREVQLHAIPASGSEQFLRANQPELRGLLRAKRVLSAFPSRQRQQRNIRMKSARQIGKQRGAFIVRMRGNVKDARGDARCVDGVNRFGKARAGAGRGRKLRMSKWENEQAEC